MPYTNEKNNQNNFDEGGEQDIKKKPVKNPSFLFVIILIIAVIIVAFSQISSTSQDTNIIDTPSVSYTPSINVNSHA